jgi:hypothetical protein
MKLRGVNRHWRDCLQVREELLNPRVFVNLKEVRLRREFAHLRVDVLLYTIRRSGWLRDRVRTIEGPGFEGAHFLDRLPNLCELVIAHVNLPAVGESVLHRLTRLVVTANPDDRKPDKALPFPSMSKLQSLEIEIVDDSVPFRYDLSDLADALPCLTSLRIESPMMRVPNVARTKPLSLRRLTCDMEDLARINLVDNFVETLHLTGSGTTPTSLRCDVVEVDDPEDLWRWPILMLGAKPKELRVLDGYHGHMMGLLLRTRISCITVHTDSVAPLPDVITLVDALEPDVTVRFVFSYERPTATYARHAWDSRQLQRVK